MPTVNRLSTVDEAAKQLGKSRDNILKELPHCAADFATRKSKKLTQAEVDCIAKRLKTKK